jgi:hypothetical protein
MAVSGRPGIILPRILPIILPAIILPPSFCPAIILPSFCPAIILPRHHFAPPSFCPHHFAPPSFCPAIILPRHHFAPPSFCPAIILPRHHFARHHFAPPSFCPTIILPHHHFAKLCGFSHSFQADRESAGAEWQNHRGQNIGSIEASKIIEGKIMGSIDKSAVLSYSVVLLVFEVVFICQGVQPCCVEP